jgi:hypothetical protein
MDSMRRIAASFLAAVFLAAAPGFPSPAQAQAQAQIRDPNELILHAHLLKYRRAAEALPLVTPLLSRHGTVELQPSSNTLVIRDTAGALNRIIPVLRVYDHPARPLTLELYIVKASRSQVSPPSVHSDLPELLTRRLRSLLPYDGYDVQAQAQLASLEGQSVTYALGDEYEVSFRVGNVAADQQVKLSGFEIVRRGDRRSAAAGPPLIAANLNLRLEQLTSFGVSRSEASPEALLIVLTLHNGDVARRLQRAEQ